MPGFLTKQGGWVKSWKRRWCVLQDRKLAYFKDHKDKLPAGVIPLTELTIVQPNDKMGKDNCFELQADKRIYYFYADKLEDMESWMNALLKVTVGWQQQVTPAPALSEITLKLSIKGMMCPQCEDKVKHIVNSTEGIQDASFDFENGNDNVEIFGKFDRTEVTFRLEEAGYLVYESA
jgi:copper chaperone CopZ